MGHGGDLQNIGMPPHPQEYVAWAPINMRDTIKIAVPTPQPPINIVKKVSGESFLVLTGRL